MRDILDTVTASLRYVLALSAIGIACSSVGGRAQTSMSSGTTMLSASVLVTWMVHSEADGASVLDVAVFWRGAPGWFTVGDPNSRSGGGSSSGLPDGRRGPETHFIAVGSLKLEVTFDPAARSAKVQGETMSTDDANVILVDDVDSPAGPRIVSTMLVDARSSNSPVNIEAVVARTPALVPFLRCDARFPNQPQRPRIEAETTQQIADLICARLTGQ
jgi:hypothetical protein